MTPDTQPSVAGQASNGHDVTPASVKRVGKESLIYLSGKIVMGIMMVVTVPVYSWFFTEEDVGRFDLALRLAVFVFALCALWLNHVIVRFRPAYLERNVEEIFLGVVGMMRLVGVGLGVILVLLIKVAGPERLFGSYRDLLGIAALVFVGRSLFETGLGLLRSKRMAGTYSIAAATNAIFKLGLGILIAVVFKVGVSGLLWGAAAVPCAVYFLLIHRHFGSLRFRFGPTERDMLKETLFYGLPICLTLIFNFFLGNIDRYLLKFLRSDAEVGILFYGNLLAEQSMTMLFSSLMLAVFPAVALAYERGGKDAAEPLVGSLTRNFLLLCVPCGVLIGVLAHPILFALAHGAARESYVVVPWIAAAYFLMGLSQYATLALHLAKRTYLLFLGIIVATGVNVISNWVLIPAHGFYACGISRFISCGVLLLIYWLVSGRYLRWWFPWASFTRIALSATVAGAVIYVLKGTLPENVLTVALFFVVGFGIYAVLTLLLREVSREEAEALFRRGRALLSRRQS